MNRDKMSDKTDFLITPISRAVWEDRYALKDENGNLLEAGILDNFRRVAERKRQKEVGGRILRGYVSERVLPCW